MKEYKHVFEKLQNVIEFTALGYAEPGYTLEKHQESILFADWNTVPDGLISALEGHFAIEWSDEWLICDSCYNAVRSIGNSYSWLPSFYITDGSVICKDCINPEDYIESIVNNYKQCNTILSDEELTGLGYVELEDNHEFGMYEHQQFEEKPESIYNRLKDKYESIVFFLTAKGQFDLNYSVYVK